MKWQEALEQSSKGTATRKQKHGLFDETIIAYRDGSGYKIVALNGKVNYDLSDAVKKEELDLYSDWQPS